MQREQLRNIPAIDSLLLLPAFQELSREYSEKLVVMAIRDVLQAKRKAILSAVEVEACDLSEEILQEETKALLAKKLQPNLAKAINATGILLHTNLGRAPLSRRAIKQVVEVARGYSNLEMDVQTGKRGSRYAHVEKMLCALTGAEAALVVNNNAAAVLLCLSTLAKGKEVIISRGQLVEIGGSFRIPEVLEQGGATLREVGATNKTKISDYRQAIIAETGLLLKVHTSNYRILGFTEDVAIAALVGLAKENDLPLVEDLGSGILLKQNGFLFSDEPTVEERIAAGVDVVTFSGDKLLGGPQAGIILGKDCYLQQMKKNPLLRALRIDKLSLAALEGTLLSYLDEEKMKQEIPFWSMLLKDTVALRLEAETLASVLRMILQGKAEICLEEGFSEAGGGALPLMKFPTILVAIKPSAGKEEDWATNLRRNHPPIFVRLQKEKILLDPRTLAVEEYEAVYQAFSDLGGEI